MNLHEAIEHYIANLQVLLQEKDEQTLLDKANKKWQEDDVRYEVLVQLLALSDGTSRFPERSTHVESEKESIALNNKPSK